MKYKIHRGIVRSERSNMKRGFVKILTVTAAMVSMLSMSMTVCAAENYTVAQGDHLMKIAQDKYGDKNQWNIIYEANKETIKEPTKIYPGQVIVIPDLPVVSVLPAVQPETVSVPEAPAVQPEAVSVPEAPAVQPEAVPAPEATPAVQPAQAAPAGMTLEEYGKDPEFMKMLDAEMQAFSGSGMEFSVVFQGNTMAVIVTITDSAYLIDGIEEALNDGLDAVEPLVDEMVDMLEDELGNPGNSSVIYSYQTADGRVLAQRAYTVK